MRALLIQKSVKLTVIATTLPIPFESFVNSEECKTMLMFESPKDLFESFVNSEECKTMSTG